MLTNFRWMQLATRTTSNILVSVVVGVLLPSPASAQTWPDSAYLRSHYTKSEVAIRMRDGVQLQTVIYAPVGGTATTPILLTRTPYSAGPYGPDTYTGRLGPGYGFADAGYIFAIQDVRGRYRSQGKFVHMTPTLTAPAGSNQIDETTDTWDTIEWLIHNVPRNNGRVGLWGGSYGGFFAAEGSIRSHPALKAVSPQAPQTDWFAGDDTHHNGAFFLTSTFNFMFACDKVRPDASATCGKSFKFPTDDGYRFFLEMGSLANAESRYFKKASPGWTDMMEHGTYDAFWQARTILPHLNKIAPAVLTVGGWYDANNFYGALHVFGAIERQSPTTDNAMVIGPWTHGQWIRDSGRIVGQLDNGINSSRLYQDEILLPFFERHLKGNGWAGHPKVWVFETGGEGRWRTFDQWPPKDATSQSIYFHSGRTLTFAPPSKDQRPGADAWVTDPSNPVPFEQGKSTDMNPDYMARDQRFSANRPDVVSYRGEVLRTDLTIGGPVSPELYVSSTGSDGDWIVKLIDVHPDGFQELVRGDVVRAKFRNSLTTPDSLVPGQVTKIAFEMPDVFHTFRRGHQLMVHVQGSWFPLVDRNPQRFLDIYRARDSDFHTATQRLYRGPSTPSRIVVHVVAARP